MRAVLTNRRTTHRSEVPPSPLPTSTSTVPAACEGRVAVSDVPLGATTTLRDGLFPKVTSVSSVKPVPVRVMVGPPAVGPTVGETPVSVVPPTNR